VAGGLGLGFGFGGFGFARDTKVFHRRINDTTAPHAGTLHPKFSSLAPVRPAIPFPDSLSR
jgi:hypothetical protein